MEKHACCMRYFSLGRMAAAAAAPTLQFYLVSPHLARISSHILPDVEIGTFLWPLCLAWAKQEGAEGHATHLNAYSVAKLWGRSSAFTRNVIICGGGVSAPNSLASKRQRVLLVWGTVKTAVGRHNKMRCYSVKSARARGILLVCSK